jgi:DNA-directed RNA polymerase subunit RPC12/RpoP
VLGVIGVPGPHAHDETLEVPPGTIGPWGWPCPRCGTENLVRERPAPAGAAAEVRCDYCGSTSEFVF